MGRHAQYPGHACLSLFGERCSRQARRNERVTRPHENLRISIDEGLIADAPHGHTQCRDRRLQPYYEGLCIALSSA